MKEICTLSDYWRQAKSDHIAELASVLEGCKSMIENMGGDPSRVTWAMDGQSRTYLDNAQVLLDVAPLNPTNGKVETPLNTDAVAEVIGYSVHEAGHLLYSREHAPWEDPGMRRGRRGGKVTVKGASKTLNSEATIDWPATQSALAETKNILEDYYIDNHVGIEWPVLGEYIARARKHYECTVPETNEIHNAVATYPYRISRHSLQGLWINVALYRHLLPVGSNPTTVDAVKRLMDISKRALNTHDGAKRAQMAVEAANVLYEFGTQSEKPPTPTTPEPPEGEPCDDGDPTDGEGDPGEGDGEAQDSGQGDNPNPDGGCGGSPAPDQPDSTGETGDGDAEGEGEGEGEGEPGEGGDQESDNPSEPKAGNQPVDDEGEAGDEGSADGEGDGETEGESDEDGAPGDSDSPSGEEAGEDSDGSDGDGNGSQGSEEGDDSEKPGDDGSGQDGRNLENRIQDILDQGENPNKANGARGYSLNGFDNRTREGLTPDDVQEIEDAVTQNLEVLTDLLDTQPNYNGEKPRVVAVDAEYDGVIEARYKDMSRKEIKEVSDLFRKQRDVADRWLFGQPKGRFDDKRLHKPFLGDPNFRKQRAVVSKPDMTVGLLLDVSGSMGRFMPLVYQTATIFSEGLLNESGINFSAWTYTSAGQGVVLTRVADSALGKLHLKVAAQGGGTPSGEAIMGAAELLARARTKHRLLIHFTDGSTNVADTQKAVAFAEKHGVKVFCIALDSFGLHEQYGEGNYTVINSVPELPKAVSDMLKQLAK